MTCATFRDGWRPGDEDGHAGSCAACAAWAADQRRAASALAHLATDLDESVVPDDREAALRAAFRRSRPPAPASPAAWRGRLAAAAAAVLLATGALSLFLVRTRTAPTATVAVRPASTTIAAPAKAAPSPAASPRPGSRAAALAVRSRPQTAPSSGSRGMAASPKPFPSPAATPAVEVASSLSPDALLTGPVTEIDRGVPAKLVGSPQEAAGADGRPFIVLSPGLDPGPMDSGQVVRVRLRPDALAAVGLAAPGRAGEPVEAEVLVGPDGVARAIRLPPARR